MIKLYTATWCAVCPGIKNKLLSAGVHFTEVDVDSIEGRQEAKDNGVRGLPTAIVLEGSTVVYEASGPSINVQRLKESAGL